MSVRLAFLFSLPRSGSTLLQRLIATHPEVSTASEPWILLPLLYTMHEEGVSAEYDHKYAYRGLVDFAKELPGGLGTYREEIKKLALNLYDQASAPGASYFLEKTPRYYLIADELIAMFPEAKFILLSRNPLAVAASVVHRFGGGSWVIPPWEPYLKAGVDHLFAPELMSRCLMVTYEDLVADPNDVTARIHKHMDLDLIEDAAEHFSAVALTGKHGDHSELRVIRKTDPFAWVATYHNPIRKRWAEGFLSWIGDERLFRMGYDATVLREALEDAPHDFDRSLQDIGRILIWKARTLEHLSWLRPTAAAPRHS